MYAEQLNVNQVLRLRIGDESLKGLIVNMTDESMLVATTSQQKPVIEPGGLILGEIFTTEGLFNFSSKLIGVQMSPVMVLVLERPRMMRKVQRRHEFRHDVDFDGLFVFISADRSINTPVDVTNLSYGGAEVLASEAPPLNMHAILLIRAHDQELSTIVRVVHIAPADGGFKLGLAFVEMSRGDVEHLHEVVALLN